MKPLVFDATPLIYLTKVGLSKLFEELEEDKLTSPLVKREIVDEGKKRGIPDAVILDKLFANGVFKILEPADKKFLNRLLETHGLHSADAQVLVLAKENEGIAIVDDEVARKTARIYDIDYAGSSYVLMRAVCEDLISKSKAKQTVNDMVSLGWRVNVESYIKILEALEKL